MYRYKIYKHSSGTTEAIKEGWPWPAFFFTTFWAIAKRMWAVGVGAFIAIFVGVAGGAAYVVTTLVTNSWLDRLIIIGYIVFLMNRTDYNHLPSR
jgi:hypothetical protein